MVFDNFMCNLLWLTLHGSSYFFIETKLFSVGEYESLSKPETWTFTLLNKPDNLIVQFTDLFKDKTNQCVKSFISAGFQLKIRVTHWKEYPSRCKTGFRIARD